MGLSFWSRFLMPKRAIRLGDPAQILKCRNSQVRVTTGFSGISRVDSLYCPRRSDACGWDVAIGKWVGEIDDYSFDRDSADILEVPFPNHNASKRDALWSV